MWPLLGAVQAGHVYDTGYPARTFCCSFRGMVHALQDYGHAAFGDAVPAPGPVLEFDPATSPLMPAAS